MYVAVETTWVHQPAPEPPPLLILFRPFAGIPAPHGKTLVPVCAGGFVRGGMPLPAMGTSRLDDCDIVSRPRILPAAWHGTAGPFNKGRKAHVLRGGSAVVIRNAKLHSNRGRVTLKQATVKVPAADSVENTSQSSSSIRSPDADSGGFRIRRCEVCCSDQRCTDDRAKQDAGDPRRH